MKHDTEPFYEEVYNLNYRTLDERFCLSLKRPRIFETKVTDKKGRTIRAFLLLLHFSDTIKPKNDVYIYELYSEQ